MQKQDNSVTLADSLTVEMTISICDCWPSSIAVDVDEVHD